MVIKKVGTYCSELRLNAGKVEDSLLALISDNGYLLENMGGGRFNVYKQSEDNPLKTDTEEDNSENNGTENLDGDGGVDDDF